MGAVPERFGECVGETEKGEAVDRPFPKVVVDPKDGLFVEAA
jgi:hypothetical protein